VIATLVASVVLAQGGGSAEELWRRYPLDPAPTPTPATTTASSAEARRRPVPELDSGDGAPVGVLVSLAVAAAALGGGATLLVVRRLGTPTATAHAPARPAAPSVGSSTATPARDPVVPAPARRPPARTRTPRVEGGPVQRGQPSRRFSPEPPEAAQPPSPETLDPRRWQVCSVTLRRSFATWYYAAEQPGSWSALIGRSPGFPAGDAARAEEALDAFLGALEEAGWSVVLDAGGAWDGHLRRERRVRRPGER